MSPIALLRTSWPQRVLGAQRREHTERRRVLGLVVVMSTVYAATLLRGVGYHGDTAKFQYLGETLGTGHPPGEPLYTLLNAGFVRLAPVGSPAVKANLLSSVLGIATLAVLYHLLRALGTRPVVSLAVAATLGLLPTFWTQAVVAEIYTLLTLVVLGLLLLFVRWRDTEDDRYLAAALFLYGLSIGIHTMVVLLAPGFLWFIWRTDRRAFLRPRFIGAFLGGVVLGLASYGYLVWRTADPTTPYVEVRVTDFGSFWSVFTSEQFRPWMFAFTPAELLTERVPQFLRLLGREYLLMLPLAAIGLYRLGRSPLNVTVLLIALANVAFALNYAVPDLPVFFILAYVVGMIWVAAGADAVLDWLRRARMPSWLQRPVRFAPAAVLVMPLAFGVANFSLADQSGNVEDADHADAVLRSVPDGSLVFPGSYHMAQFLWYEQLVGDSSRAADVLVASYAMPVDELHEYLEDDEAFEILERRRTVEPGRPVYVLEPGVAVELLDDGFDVVEVAVPTGSLYRVEPDTGPAFARPLEGWATERSSEETSDA